MEVDGGRGRGMPRNIEHKVENELYEYSTSIQQRQMETNTVRRRERDMVGS